MEWLPCSTAAKASSPPCEPRSSCRSTRTAVLSSPSCPMRSRTSRPPVGASTTPPTTHFPTRSYEHPPATVGTAHQPWFLTPPRLWNLCGLACGKPAQEDCFADHPRTLSRDAWIRRSLSHTQGADKCVRSHPGAMKPGGSCGCGGVETRRAHPQFVSQVHAARAGERAPPVCRGANLAVRLTVARRLARIGAHYSRGNNAQAFQRAIGGRIVGARSGGIRWNGAVAQRLIDSKDVADNSLVGKDIKNSTLTTQDVKDVLTATDFRGGLPQGTTGQAGPQGPPGPQGPRLSTGASGPQGPRETPDQPAAVRPTRSCVGMSPTPVTAPAQAATSPSQPRRRTSRGPARSSLWSFGWGGHFQRLRVLVGESGAGRSVPCGGGGTRGFRHPHLHQRGDPSGPQQRAAEDPRLLSDRGGVFPCDPLVHRHRCLPIDPSGRHGDRQFR